ncbi:hypothetical protein [uncultured Tenacibaculum sp.]|uniref:hypothetical protein n=1 Tax=uncultured Tenacibaculum sp. TaxID=174713 RepID=UPI002620226F|nr:hypothetical protein [uncultured Tenacibaculum sp.]
MRKIAPYFLALSLVFASCSSNEGEIIDNNKSGQKLLKSYTLKRDGSGAYSIDFDVQNNTEVATFKGKGNSNDIVLSESQAVKKKSYSNEYAIENDQLKIGFIENNSGKKTNISVTDDNITFARGTVTEFLNSYSITSNEDNTYRLDFKVNEDVKAEFIYNEIKDVYEVHLSKGDAKQVNFSRHFEMSHSGVLKINFVNHKFSGRAQERMTTEKPKTIIVSDPTIG